MIKPKPMDLPWNPRGAGTGGQYGPARRKEAPLTVVGGYTLHLYCCMINPNHSWEDLKVSEFYSETGAEARRMARHDGWRFNRDKTATCPRCVEEGL